MILGRIYTAVETLEPDCFLLVPLSRVRETLGGDSIWALMYHWKKEMWYVSNFDYDAYFGSHYALQFTPREIKKIPSKNTKPMDNVVKHQAFRAVFR